MAKTKAKTVYVCQNCGAQRPKWEGRCNDCGEWNSLVEETFASPDQSRGWTTSDSTPTETVTLEKTTKELHFYRFPTAYQELDRVLGGGLVKGSFVLLGGAPGIGKSTLLMQMAGGLARGNRKILYVSGEESVEQTSHRAHRLGIRNPTIHVASLSNLSQIISLARNQRPEVLVVDSIQTVFLPELSSAPGSVSQVRECAGHLMTLAKNEGIAVILIGHVTKDGSLAGPKVLEHMVDTVLSFDGEMTHNFRLLRALKNRFGATHELGVFQMSGEGLKEVTNPSELFLEERENDTIGSAIFASMEGSRPMLCEVQALATPTPMAMPRRTSIGIDFNRLHLITAVLSRHLDLGLANSDVYVNVVGGLKLIEPASDLAMTAALISSERRIPLGGKTCFFGEVGLTGEVRAVSFVENRINEALRLGFDNFVLPMSNQKHFESKNLKGTFHWIKSVKELSKIIIALKKQ